MAQMILKSFFAACAVATALPAPAGARAPHLAGELAANPQTGELSGNLCVSLDRPAQDLLLNRGLNIRSIRTRSGDLLDFELSLAGEQEADAAKYRLTGGPVDEACVSYVGKFPVYRVDAGERAAQDWKGLIAFDGRTVRATEQSRFYPVLIDDVTGQPLDQATYDLSIDCRRCRAAHLNGSAPSRGRRNEFHSSIARPLLLYAGDIGFSRYGDVNFVGAEVSAAAADALNKAIGRVRAAHEAALKMEMKDDVTMISFASVGRNRTLGRNTWGFATWPTIANDGRVDFDALVDDAASGGLSADREIYLAHEMAHYYFGAVYAPRGPLSWFLLESTAEYLALSAVRELRGVAAYEAIITQYVKDLDGVLLTPLDEATSASQLDEAFRYRAGPLLLIALENAAGAGPVRDLLRGMLSDIPAQPMTYEEFRRRVLAAGAQTQSVKRWEEACLATALSAECRNLIEAKK